MSVVVPSPAAIGRLSPLGATDVALVGGFWADRARINRATTIPHGHAELLRAGTLQNLRLAAGAQGSYRALNDTFGTTFPFLDTDVYKWLEAVGWELGHGWDDDLATAADDAIAVVQAAQRADGYINSYVQVVSGGTPYQNLAWGHEFYCVGHLIQAAIAWHRSLGDDRLLLVATRAADAIDRAFGATGRDGIDGHPEIEMALVELWRVTAERRYLDLATRLVDLRGHGLIPDAKFGPAYWQDHLPVRSAATVAGHAVRQLYLDCGAVDVAVETGDRDLLDAVIRRWSDMVATRMYITGGLGSRHRDEAFGDPFELPPDGAYAETCAAIASVMLSWRLLLATGEARFADLIERTAYNGLLSGVSLGGAAFFYVNPLQRRRSSGGATPGDGARASWYPCACCPPNLMRTLSTWEHYLATTDERGIQLHQYASSDIGTVVGDLGRVEINVATSYPWTGHVVIRIVETPAAPWSLSLRVPPGATGARVVGPDEAVTSAHPGTVVDITRSWRPGEELILDLDLGPVVVGSDPRVEATRGMVALERGPLVYCVEQVDLPDGIELETLTVHPDAAAVEIARDDIAASIVGLELPATGRGANDQPAAVRVGAIPYFAWANRTVEAMQVWIPAVPPPGEDEGSSGDGTA